MAHALKGMSASHRKLHCYFCIMHALRPWDICLLGQAVFGAPGALGWAPSRLDAEVLWRML